MAHLARLAGGAFADLEPARRAEVAAAFREAGGAPLAALVRVVLLCYYRDDRVMHSLGLEPRPPFPKGHVVEQGDWSLLDPVRARPPMYRSSNERIRRAVPQEAVRPGKRRALFARQS